MAAFEISLYLHIPFCTEKCGYCDFYSISSRCPDSYLKMLLNETERRKKEITSEYNSPVMVPSVYIGGGTPSVLGAQGIARLLEGIVTITGESGTEEITVEANPETATPDFLLSCRDHGVTRISLGVQSFDETVLNAAGRGRSVSPEKSLNEAGHIFGRGLSVDLMSGLPGQNKKILLNDIERTLSYNPGHISLYALTPKEGSSLTGHSAENEDWLWLLGRDELKKAGFEHYEISNFAVSVDYRSLHNIRYWRMNNWLGIGPSASGTIINNDGTGIRSTYQPDAIAFSNGVNNKPAIEKLDKSTVIKETLLMGYRFCDGPDPVLFLQRFGKSIEDTIPQTLSAWQKKTGTIPLQETIMCFLNPFLLDAFIELDKSN